MSINVWNWVYCLKYADVRRQENKAETRKEWKGLGKTIIEWLITWISFFFPSKTFIKFIERGIKSWKLHRGLIIRKRARKN